jgi:hypothetical protein
MTLARRYAEIMSVESQEEWRREGEAAISDAINRIRQEVGRRGHEADRFVTTTTGTLSRILEDTEDINPFHPHVSNRQTTISASSISPSGRTTITARTATTNTRTERNDDIDDGDDEILGVDNNDNNSFLNAEDYSEQYQQDDLDADSRERQEVTAEEGEGLTPPLTFRHRRRRQNQ